MMIMMMIFMITVIVISPVAHVVVVGVGFAKIQDISIYQNFKWSSMTMKCNDLMCTQKLTIEASLA